MSASDNEIRDRIVSRLEPGRTGMKKRFADHLGISQNKVSKMISQGDDQSPWKISAAELLKAFEFFGDDLGLLGDVLPEGARQVPLVALVSAGKLVEAIEAKSPIDAPVVQVCGLGAGTFIALEVEGESMARVSPPGSVIIVDLDDKELLPGRAYVFMVRGEATYKRWKIQPERLEPDTYLPGFETIYPDLESLIVLGRVRRTTLDL